MNGLEWGVIEANADSGERRRQRRAQRGRLAGEFRETFHLCKLCRQAALTFIKHLKGVGHSPVTQLWFFFFSANYEVGLALTWWVIFSSQLSPDGEGIVANMRFERELWGVEGQIRVWKERFWWLLIRTVTGVEFRRTGTEKFYFVGARRCRRVHKLPRFPNRFN